MFPLSHPNAQTSDVVLKTGIGLRTDLKRVLNPNFRPFNFELKKKIRFF